MPARQNPFLLPFRAESLLSWAEFVRVNRPDDDSEPNAAAARDMEVLSVSQDGGAILNYTQTAFTAFPGSAP